MITILSIKERPKEKPKGNGEGDNNSVMGVSILVVRRCVQVEDLPKLERGQS